MTGYPETLTDDVEARKSYSQILVEEAEVIHYLRGIRRLDGSVELPVR